MHEVTPTDVGVSIVAVVVILQTVFKFLDRQTAKKAEADGSSRGFSTKDRSLLYELHKMHDRVDRDGVYVWHNRVSLEESITKLTDTIEHLARTQEVQLVSFERMCDEMHRQRRAPTEDG